VSEAVDYSTRTPGILCLTVGTRLIITLGAGWPVPSVSNGAMVLVSSRTSPSGSTATYRAAATGDAILQTGHGPPACCPSVTSVVWTQEVRVVSAAK
jgi:hypothetical protein